ncbi:MAG: MtrB/PioB family outer membrane beta-barrel protein [Acidobacteria bacterium]|nr:MtrB/PioB family outer membrane beta-barrel protein [Acidobacteriota bacterium]MCB9377158.1 MtrB/PioB family outer membrane beta-barrel protein [Holophagales bacterium]
MRAHNRIATSLAAAALLLTGAPLAAEGGFQLHLDQLVVGVYDVDVDTDSSKFNEYRDWSNGFQVPRIKISGEDAESGRYLDFSANWVGRRDARYGFEYGVSGKWGLMVDYNKIPHRFGNDGKILFAETSPGRWELSDAIQGNLQATLVARKAAGLPINYQYLAGLLDPYLSASALIDLDLQRDRTHVAFELGKMGRLAWNLDYKYENRTGERPYGSSFGFGNVVELPEPIDYNTTDATLSGELKGKNGGLTFGYHYSKFENENASMIWDNPFRLTDSTHPSAYSAPSSTTVDGSSLGEAALSPDNDAGWLFVNGRFRAGNWNLNGGITYGTMEQNDALLPYALNTAIDGENFNGSHLDPTLISSLPTANADNKVDVLNITANAKTTFGEAFDLSFKYRYYDYDNGSKRIEFPGYVRYHAVWEEIGRITVPSSYTVADYGAEFGWSFGKTSRLGFSYTLESWDRTYREIDSSDEDIFKISYDGRFGIMDLRAAYEFGDRSISDYHTEAQEESFIHPEGINNQPDLRKYDEAAREYDSFYAQATFMLGERSDLTLGFNTRNDDYKDSKFGLTEDEITQYNAEYSISLNDAGNLYIFWNHTERTNSLYGRQSGGSLSTNPLDDWGADFEELNDTIGLGWARDFGSWNVDLHGTYNKSDGKADIYSPPGGTPNIGVGFDDYEDIEIFSARVKVDYQILENLSVGLDYLYEDYTYDTFLTRGLTYYMPAALLLNPNFSDYTANVIGLRFKMSL